MEVRRLLGGRGCRGAALLVRLAAEAGAALSRPRSAPGGRCGRQGPAPRPQLRSRSKEISVEGGIRWGQMPEGSGELLGTRGGSGSAW